MNEGKEIRLSVEQSDALVKNIRKLMDAEFDSIKTTTQYGKTYRAESECDIMKQVYKELLVKMGVKSSTFRHYKLIAVNHIEAIENELDN